MTSIYSEPSDQNYEIRAQLQKHHNKAAGEIVHSIVKPIVDLGGTQGDALVMLESVIVGVLLTMHPNGDEIRLQRLILSSAKRLGEVREQNRKRAMT